MPETPKKIWRQLGINENSDVVSWDSTRRWDAYPLDAKVNRGEVIFPRIDIKKELEELENLLADNE